MNRLNLLVPSLILLICLATQSSALPEDREKPIKGKANTTNIDANTGKSIMTGNVVITQGMLTIYADQVTFERDQQTDKLNYLLAVGNPVRFIDTPSLEESPIEVTGAQIEYFPQDNNIITLGDAKIVQEKNEANGERIHYNTLTGIMTIESDIIVNQNSEGQQAEFILQPEASE